jgi:hypothetical protein
MTVRSPHPFRTAIERRDLEAITATLHPNVAYHHPLVEVPVRGREQVWKVFALFASVVEEGPEFVGEFSGDRTHALVMRFRVDGRPIEAIDHLQLDDKGRIDEIVGAMRPFTAVRALAHRVAGPLGGLIAAQGANDAERFERSGLAEVSV